MKIAQGTDVSFGTFGLKAVGRGRLTARQIEAARRAMTRAVKRQGKIWIRVFPDKPTQYSTLPLPLPIRTSSGFSVIGLSGNTRIQILP